MRRILSEITTIAKHLHAMRNDPAVYRPEQCPDCGFGRLYRPSASPRSCSCCLPSEAPHNIPSGGWVELACLAFASCSSCSASFCEVKLLNEGFQLGNR